METLWFQCLIPPISGCRGRHPRRPSREAAVRYTCRKMLRIFRRDVEDAVPYIYFAQNLPDTPNQASMHITAVMAAKVRSMRSSAQPHFSKWWWMGAILKNRLPWVSLK